MLGLMQNHPLLVSSLIEHAGKAHPNSEVISRTPDGPILDAPMPNSTAVPGRLPVR
jgi:hypothetical protein